MTSSFSEESPAGVQKALCVTRTGCRENPRRKPNTCWQVALQMAMRRIVIDIMIKIAVML